MANQENKAAPSGTAFTQSVSFDAGLRDYMVRIFNTVAAGLLVSGVASFIAFKYMWTVFQHPGVNTIIGLGLLAFLWFGMNPNKMMREPLSTVRLKYYLFTALLGTTLSYIFVLYTHSALLRVFLITAATFGATSLIGYTTKRDLTNMGSFLMMGLIGIIIASVVNLFTHSAGLMFGISIIGVLVFTGLIAVQTQQAKRFYSPSNSDEVNQKLAVISALSMYINFINLFQMLLNLMGGRN